MKSLLVAALLLLPVASFAADNPDQAVSSLKDADLVRIDTNLQSCMDKDMSTYGMKVCTSQAIDAANKILNQVYNSKVQELKQAGDDQSREILNRLVSAERAWITFRDAEAGLEGTADIGGTLEGLDILSATLDLTKQRIVTLRNL